MTRTLMRYLGSHCCEILDCASITCETKQTHPSVSVEHIDVITGVQVIDGTFAVDFKGIYNQVEFSGGMNISKQSKLTFVHLDVN